MADLNVAIVGIGNELRGDDGAGVAAVRRLQRGSSDPRIVVYEHQGETAGLIELISGCHGVVFVDAVHADLPPGTIRRFDLSDEAFPEPPRGSTSTHALALAETIELARALGRLPKQVVVYGLVGRSFDTGSPLSDEVARAIDPLSATVLDEARELLAA